MAVVDWVSRRVFNFVHRNNLVYNTCWEDPRLDREALQLTSEDDVLVITSAGCNALDYVLCEPRSVHAVDMNPRQNALLELKIAGIRRLDFPTFFQLFGQGRLSGVKEVYRDRLRPELSARSQRFWDRRIRRFFDSPNRTFYYRGTSGAFARLIKTYIDRVIKVRPHVDALLAADTVEEQRRIFDEHLRERFWTGPMRALMGRDTTLSMLGVPRAQRKEVERHYEGGIVRFVQDCLEAVFTTLPISDNYFWRVYINGSYTRECCPEYLREENFARLKEGLVDRVHTHTDSVQGFLEGHTGTISRYVLLDHMDWLSDQYFPLLEAEWQAIVDRAAPGTRILWRSGGLQTDFVDRARVRLNGASREVGELLQHHAELAARLHQLDRVHTYGSFYIADLTT